MGKAIMVQGTASSVGKSIITAGLCRVLKNRGFKVAPFKAQNMALNSFITAKGLEMGRAQVVQAEAAGVEPSVLMNPVLLKPSTDKNAQVIVNGKVSANMSAQDFHAYKPKLAGVVKEAYETLAAENDYIVIEGAGSPAEINLREGDIVNMGMAEIANAPVLLVGDIDRGGVFASLYGTILLVSEEERARIKGAIINKFRGDVEILKPGLTMFEDLSQTPVLGVVPYSNLNIEDEDSLAERFRRRSTGKGQVVVSVLYLPHVSNFTDFNALDLIESVELNYVMRGQPIPKSDVIIIPGSKNTIEDMIYLQQSGLSKEIIRHQRAGGRVVGICGGFQMLGSVIKDPELTESAVPEIAGLGLLMTETTFEPIKTTTQVKARVESDLPEFSAALSNLEVEGYEIHMGQTVLKEGARPFVHIEQRLEEKVDVMDGAIDESGRVFGTYLHGIFDNREFSEAFVNQIRHEKGLDKLESSKETFSDFKNREYDKLAEILEQSLDIDAIIRIADEF